MFHEPFVHIEEEKLFAPEHPGQRLAHDKGLIFADTRWGYGFVELIGLALAGLHDFSKALEGVAHGRRRWSLSRRRMVAVFPAAYIQLIVCRRLRSRFLGVDGVVISVDHVVVDSIFDVRRGVGRAKDPLVVGLVFREQQRDISLAVQIALPQIGVRGCNRLSAFLARDLLQGRLGCTGPPCPGVAKP